MTSRVDNDRDAQRMDEQRRMQQQDETKRKQNAQEFAKVVQEKKNASTKATTKSQEKNTGTKTQQDRQGQMLMARNGIQAHKFGDMLGQQGQKSVKDSDTNQKTRQSEHKEASKLEAKQAKADQAQAAQHSDQLAPISRDDRKRDSSGGGDDAGGNKGDQQQKAGGDPTMATQGKQLQGGSAAQEAKGAGPQVKIPQAALQEIVSRVLVGMNKDGLSEMHIQFKDGVLGGASLQISASGGNIKAKFTVGDQNTKRLLKASEGELARAFGHKGMRLESMEVETR